VSWLLGDRDGETAKVFLLDLASRLRGRVQLTSDGHKPYLAAVEEAFGADVDYAMLVKIYGDAPEGQKRYSPAECVGCRSQVVTGRPDPDHISTSYAERLNLSIGCTPGGSPGSRTRSRRTPRTTPIRWR
jgi:hypothetical protein